VESKEKTTVISMLQRQWQQTTCQVMLNYTEFNHICAPIHTHIHR